MQEKEYLHGRWAAIMSWGLLAVMGFLLLLRTRYGMDTTDETFYLATARRFYDGDFLFKHDWNTAQVMGLVLLPVYRAYVLVHGSSEGIILFSRILLVFFGFGLACFLFRTLIKNTKSRMTALAVSICMLLYVRGNIINLSYYSLGMYTFVFALLLWMRSGESGHRQLCLAAAGISFSLSVLCMPYMVFLFCVIVILGLVCWIRKDTEKVGDVRSFLCGVFFSGVVFLALFGRYIPWNGLLEYLPMIFRDPEMEQEGIFVQLFDLLVYYTTVFLKYTWPLYLVTAVISVWFWKNHRKSKNTERWLDFLLLAEFFVQAVYVRTYFEGGIIAVFLLLALQLQLIYPDIRLKKLEHYFLVPGFLFGIVWVIASNVGQRSINMSFLIMDIWAVSFVLKLGGQSGKGLRGLYSCAVILLTGLLFIIRFLDVYRDGAVSQLTNCVETGVMKGIYTEELRGAVYEKTVKVLQEQVHETDTAVVLGCNPWAYMDLSGSCGSYSTWNLQGEDVLLEQYYELCPEKIPTVILVMPPELDKYVSWRFSSHGSGVHNGKKEVPAGILADMIQKGDYQRVEIDGVTIYRK